MSTDTKRSLFVVEDEFMILLNRVDQLQSVGYEVFEAGSVNVAAAQVENFKRRYEGRKIDALLTDWKLEPTAPNTEPGGKEAIRLMRREFPDAKIFIISSWPREEVLKACEDIIDINKIKFIPKTVSDIELLRIIQNDVPPSHPHAPQAGPRDNVCRPLKLAS